MIILSKVLHTSRPVELADTGSKIAANYEKVLDLRPGTVRVDLIEHDEMKPCKTNELPHCHYAVTISYDETAKNEPIDKV